MLTHDVLAFAFAEETIRRIRNGNPEWSLFSRSVYASSSRTWPVPDFVIVDEPNKAFIAGEFKPPGQTKREYLTGLGQAIAYTKDFNYSLLVVPTVSDDNFAIANHIESVLGEPVAQQLPVGILRYDPAQLSLTSVVFDIPRQLQARTGAFSPKATVDPSFWAKWRDISPLELALFLGYLYEEGRPGRGGPGTIRDRAFESLWSDIQRGVAEHWGGGRRTVRPTAANRTAWGKNYRNFITHIGWTLPDGKLTAQGLHALHLFHQYGEESRMFLDFLARSVLIEGKHLVLINAMNEFQDQHYRDRGRFRSEKEWLDKVESDLQNDGLLKRNPARHKAAVQKVERGFLKAEKTLWRNLNLFVPAGARGGRAYHPGRGFVFDWARITALVQSA